MVSILNFKILILCPRILYYKALVVSLVLSIYLNILGGNSIGNSCEVRFNSFEGNFRGVRMRSQQKHFSLSPFMNT